MSTTALAHVQSVYAHVDRIWAINCRRTFINFHKYRSTISCVHAHQHLHSEILWSNQQLSINTSKYIPIDMFSMQFPSTCKGLYLFQHLWKGSRDHKAALLTCPSVIGAIGRIEIG
jgi:hypothetical protein